MLPFELPVLRSVPEKPQTPPVAKSEPELVLPPLRRVPEKKPDPAEAPQVSTPTIEWEIRPLDSRPNLQALLEKEQRAAEAAVQGVPPAQGIHYKASVQVEQKTRVFQQHEQHEYEMRQLQLEQQYRMQEEQAKLQLQEKLFRQKQEEQQRQTLLHEQHVRLQQLQKQQHHAHHRDEQHVSEELRRAEERQLAKLSVKLKVQRFETAIPMMTPAQPGVLSPPVLTGRNKPLPGTSVPFPVKQPEVPVARPAAHFKENKLPAEPVPAPAPAAAVPAPKPTSSVNSAAKEQVHLPPLVDLITDIPILRSGTCTLLVLRFKQWHVTVFFAQLGKLRSLDSDSAMNRRSFADYANYNKAPRGWTAPKDNFRPVSFKA